MTWLRGRTRSGSLPKTKLSPRSSRPLPGVDTSLVELPPGCDTVAPQHVATKLPLRGREPGVLGPGCGRAIVDLVLLHWNQAEARLDIGAVSARSGLGGGAAAR